MNTIHYICNFDNHDSGYSLNTQASTNSKASYILQSLNEAGFKVYIHSTAIGNKEKVKRKTLFYNNFSIEYLYSISRKSIIHKIISTLLVYIQITRIWFISPKEDTFLIYHSLKITKLFNILKKISHRHNIIIEIEEIYSVVYKLSKKNILSEIRSLSNYDGYILVNESIGKLCGINDNFIVCHGNYCPKTMDDNILNKDKIYIVYAGALNEDMNMAIEVAKLLPQTYHLYILGYGSEEQIRKLKQLNKNNNYAAVEYMGCLFGEDYYSFLRNCNIGLCTRIVEDEESLYAFPSKILAYLSCNLLTISTPLQSIYKSRIAPMVFFSDDYSANSIANTIKLVVNDNASVNYSKRLIDYHNNFVNEIKLHYKM